MKKLAVMVAAALEPVALVNVAHADAALATAKGCTACHQVDKKVIGPAYNAVAACYARNNALKGEPHERDWHEIRLGCSGRKKAS